MIIDKQNRWAIINPPRTGTHTLRHVLALDNIADLLEPFHGTTLPEGRNVARRIIIIVRHPIDRLYSLFRYGLWKESNQPHGGIGGVYWRAVKPVQVSGGDLVQQAQAFVNALTDDWSKAAQMPAQQITDVVAHHWSWPQWVYHKQSDANEIHKIEEGWQWLTDLGVNANMPMLEADPQKYMRIPWQEWIARLDLGTRRKVYQWAAEDSKMYGYATPPE